MPITSDQGGKNYTLGRGRLYFSRFTPAQVSAGITASTQAEGERFFGNVPEMSITSNEETLDHFASTGGIRVKDDSVSLQLDRTGSFTTDNIDLQNLALLYLGDNPATLTQASITAATWTVTAKQGRFYQIGESSALPTGVRNVSSIVVKTGSPGFATTVSASGNYEVDETLGRLYIVPGAPGIADNTIIQVTYNAAAGTRSQVIAKSQSIYGALHWIADNPKGTNFDMVMPYVKLSPNGDYNLLGDDWQSMSFSFEALTKGDLATMYLDGRQA
jgi:hypothetical protein